MSHWKFPVIQGLNNLSRAWLANISSVTKMYTVWYINIRTGVVWQRLTISCTESHPDQPLCPTLPCSSFSECWCCCCCCCCCSWCFSGFLSWLLWHQEQHLGRGFTIIHVHFIACCQWTTVPGLTLKRIIQGTVIYTREIKWFLHCAYSEK